MPPKHTFAGELSQYERPNWDPLIDLVVVHLVRWFMWMHELELDGTPAHAYKHVATRRYLHVGEDGRLFGYVLPFRYQVVEPRQALDEVFFEWEETLPQPDEAALAALEQLRRKAAS